MKNLFISIMACIICMLSLSGCTSENHKITNKYAHEIDLPLIERTVFFNTAGGYVTAFYVKNFNEVLVDTLYIWEAFMQTEVADAVNRIENANGVMDSLCNLKAEMLREFGTRYDTTEINKKIMRAKTNVIADSARYLKALLETENLKYENEVLAYGYTFDEVYRVRQRSETLHGEIYDEYTETIHKIIYITKNGEVYQCVPNFN